jgi:lipopolysaccharide export system permease protein
VFVRERDSNNNLSGILLHDSRDPTQAVTMIAEHGRVEQTESGPKFYLQRGMRQQMKDGRINWLAFDDYALEIAFYNKVSSRSYSPEEQTISGLYQREGLTDKQARAYRAEANQRLTWPIFALALPLFSLATLFSSEFNRRGQTRRMVGAAIGMTVIVLVYFSLRNMTAKYGNLAPLLYVLVFGLTAVSSYVLVFGRIFRFGSRLQPEPGRV